LDIEKLRIVPGFTETNAFDLYYMPYTHSLPGSIALSFILGAIVALFISGNRASTILLVAAAAFSHWILDLIQVWFALEPDPMLMASIVKKRELASLPNTVKPILGTLAQVEREGPLDTILYIDVLEHIADDAGELRRAAELLASVANLLFLKQSNPKMSQIMFWDRMLVPCSRILDAVTARTFGRSVVAVWRRDAKS
jgi:hypothetical protein